MTVVEGGSTTYTGVLTIKPTPNVTVNISDPANFDVITNSGTLTFKKGYWNVPQIVAVSAQKNADRVLAKATMKHIVMGVDEYEYAITSEVDVTILDEDTPLEITFTENPLTATHWTELPDTKSSSIRLVYRYKAIRSVLPRTKLRCHRRME